LPEGLMVRVGVLADVEGGQVQAERGNGADGPLQSTAGGQFAAMAAQ